MALDRETLLWRDLRASSFIYLAKRSFEESHVAVGLHSWPIQSQFRGVDSISTTIALPV